MPMPLTTPLTLSKGDNVFVMQVTGTLLLYTREIDSTTLPALSTIASEHNAPNENTMKRVKKPLDYATSQEEAIIIFNVSGMVLAIHSNASYLSEKNARSRAGGHHLISSDKENPPNNGAVLNLSTITRSVMSSSAKAELGILFLNAKTALTMSKTLGDLVHPQP